MVELWFIFSLIWSVCTSVDEDGCKKTDNFLREIEGTFPNKDTIYEYYVDTKNKTASFYKIMVPTVDMVCYHYLVKALVSAQHPVLLTSPVGTGKTSVTQSVLQSLDSVSWAMLTINMSSQESQIKRIYGTMISQKLQEFEEEVKPIGGILTQATLELYHANTARFLPTPTKMHYLFNLRDISKALNIMCHVGLSLI
ncbi:hypothetical protein cypCar_00000647 [Cyprinus carpio]|nr:hypothetical protein cypCar_00000647 [Cyprinus carpio]